MGLEIHCIVPQGVEPLAKSLVVVIAVDDDKLDIEFDKAGTKRVLDRFVEKVG